MKGTGVKWEGEMSQLERSMASRTGIECPSTYSKDKIYSQAWWPTPVSTLGTEIRESNQTVKLKDSLGFSESSDLALPCSKTLS